MVERPTPVGYGIIVAVSEASEDNLKLTIRPSHGACPRRGSPKLWTSLLGNYVSVTLVLFGPASMKHLFGTTTSSTVRVESVALVQALSTSINCEGHARIMLKENQLKPHICSGNEVAFVAAVERVDLVGLKR